MSELVVETKSGKIRGVLRNTVPKSTEVYRLVDLAFSLTGLVLIMYRLVAMIDSKNQSHMVNGQKSMTVQKVRPSVNHKLGSKFRTLTLC